MVPMPPSEPPRSMVTSQARDWWHAWAMVRSDADGNDATVYLIGSSGGRACDSGEHSGSRGKFAVRNRLYAVGLKPTCDVERSMFGDLKPDDETIRGDFPSTFRVLNPRSGMSNGRLGASRWLDLKTSTPLSWSKRHLLSIRYPLTQSCVLCSHPGSTTPLSSQTPIITPCPLS